MPLGNTCALCKDDVDFVPENGQLSTRQDHGCICNGWYWTMKVYGLCSICSERLSDTVKSESSQMLSESLTGKCEKCGKMLEISKRIYPHQQEISDDGTTLCNCCEECSYKCRMDIKKRG